jgi:Xaa-Pro aminopeptidase
MNADGGDAVAVFPAANVVPRDNHSPLHGYRPDTDVHYLTGFSEPRSVLVLTKDKYVLFVQPNERDIWAGPKAGIAGAIELYGADEAFPIAELDTHLPKLLANRHRVFYRIGKDKVFDEKILGLLVQGRSARRASTRWPTEITDSGTIVHELRLYKDQEEIAALRLAAVVTAEAHRRVMALAKPGMYEHELEGALFETFRRRGGRPAYGIVVASGPSASVLQYWKNDRRMEDGELVLVDAACMVGELACDVSRTFPVNSKFSPQQRAIYELVLKAQLEGIELARPGSTIEKIQEKHAEVFTEGLHRLGILKGHPSTLLHREAHKAFSLHRSTHWLGMDPHDVGVYYDKHGADRLLEPGMLMSNEPGIYIERGDMKVAPEWRGICVRIEDDILVTNDAPIVLTEAVPKTIEDVERACRAVA